MESTQIIQQTPKYNESRQKYKDKTTMENTHS